MNDDIENEAEEIRDSRADATQHPVLAILVQAPIGRTIIVAHVYNLREPRRPLDFQKTSSRAPWNVSGLAGSTMAAAR